MTKPVILWLHCTDAGSFKELIEQPVLSSYEKIDEKIKANYNDYNLSVYKSKIPDVSKLSLSDSSVEESFEHVLVEFKQKIFIESLDIYEAFTDSHGKLVKIEAFKFDDDSLVCLWEDNEALFENVNRNIIKSKLKHIKPFECYKLKLTVSKYKIEFIEVKGKRNIIINRRLSQDYEKDTVGYGHMVKSSFKLVANELFADIYLLVENILIPAHRNILKYRCKYFADLFEANKTIEYNKDNPIKIDNIEYEFFMVFLNFIYTGHIDIKMLELNGFLKGCNGESLDYNRAIELVCVIDDFKIYRVTKWLIDTITTSITNENVLKVYSISFERLPKSELIIDFCYDHLLNNFHKIAITQEFLKLPKNYMIDILKKVAPKLPSYDELQERLNAKHTHNDDNDDDNDDDDDDDDDDNNDDDNSDDDN